MGGIPQSEQTRTRESMIAMIIVQAAFHRVWNSFTAGAIAMLATVFGDIAAPVVTGNWLVDIRTVCAVGGIVIAGTWWLAKKFQHIEDQLYRAEEARREMQMLLTRLIKNQPQD